MPLAAGSRVGAYEIAEPIGSGGMGEVFRAVDTTLNRSVAIKVLPSSLAHDADRLARFEREAQTLASLNHPNIAQVYGFEKGEGADRALVMELVEGPTLADRIATGPIPLDEAMPIALQIAEALESAHDLGIVHRDLKPANIKVRLDGTVKVLDFGLAKAIAREPVSGSIANSPTMTTPAMTQAGMILGTAAYMSPEQAKGKVVDRRTDIWAFGCVVFEMLTGATAFPGDEVSDVLVAIMRDEPAWQRLPASTPRHLTTMLQRCLQKDVKKRLPHIGVARLELSGDASEPGVVSPAASFGQRILHGFAWLSAGAVASGIAFVLIGRFAPAAMERQVTFEIAPPKGAVFSGNIGVPRIALSRDGRRVVYQASFQGQPRLWVRALDSNESRPITMDGAAPTSDLSMQQAFWSPDGQAIAFFDEVERKLKAVDAAGGVVRTICDVAGNQLAGSWGVDGTIVFSSLATGGILKVASTGGVPTPVTSVDQSRGEASHLWPDLLPDGRHVVYLVSGGSKPGIYVQAIAGGTPVFLLESAAMARVAAPNRLLFVRGTALVTQEIDLDRLQLRGDAIQVTDSVGRTPAGRVAVSTSARGDVVYAAALSGADPSEAVWMDRRGVIDETIPPLPMASLSLRLSNDGRTLAYSRINGQQGEIWLYDTERGVSSPLPLGPASDATQPIFSTDGSQIYFRRVIGRGFGTIERQPVSGVTQPVELLRALMAEAMAPLAVTIDPPRLLYLAAPGGRRGLWVLPLNGTAKPTPYIDQADARVLMAALSPDNRHVALTLGHPAQSQLFVQTFPDPTQGRWPVSGIGGTYPRWRPDGKELFYVEAGAVYAVPVVGAARPIGEAAKLFELPPFVSQTGLIPYDVTADGQRFVVVRRREVNASRAFTVILNWQPRR
jgi:eukaryotic-like serine/threonine-protein kinase